MVIHQLAVAQGSFLVSQGFSMGDLRRAEGWGGRFLGVTAPRPPVVELIERREPSSSERTQGAGGGAKEEALEVRLPVLKVW